MFHRGPDDAGLWISERGTVGLAQRRLSILDLSVAGRQPMSDGDRRITITFNGEIYNYREIRQDLEHKGYIFNSQTDTEVIINAYKEWGTDCLTKFNGMFAFGIFDENRDKLFVARDRVGKKPLYYSQSDDDFAFASEIKALIRDGNRSREIELRALNFYLTFGYIPWELCIFKSIKKLPPAHAMIYDLNTWQIKIWRYWHPPALSRHDISEDELLEELEVLLKDAVRLRMISDVPIGAFLSGGVDSSLVVAMMSRLSVSPVKTFSIGFEEDRYNELPYAKIVADHFGTQHHELTVKPDVFSILPNLVHQFDEPFSDSSMIPTYYVSRATREYVTVALSGDGGDELFGGYNHYLGTLGNHYAAKFTPSSVRKWIAACAENLPRNFHGKKQLIRLRLDPYNSFVDRANHLYFNGFHRSHLLSKKGVDSLGSNFFEPETSRLEHLREGTRDFINRLTHTDFKTYLPDDILVKVDRASMLVSLEVRAPFLDYRMAEFSFGNIPGSLKVKRATTKYLLKKLAKRILPKELDINRKWGFTVPMSEWFRGPLFKGLRGALLDDNNQFFNEDYIEKLLHEHKRGINHEGRLFSLLIFSLWKNTYLDGKMGI